MYVDHFPRLSFEDMVYATQRSAGLGQVDLSSLENLPVESPGTSAADVYNQQLTAVAGTTSWTTIALLAAAVVGGFFIIKGVAR